MVLTFCYEMTLLCYSQYFQHSLQLTQPQQTLTLSQTMNYHQTKDSIYQIQPWAEDSSTIPHSFLNTSHFSKTPMSKKYQINPHQKLQISTNTVYFIKNQPQQTEINTKPKFKHHHTAQNSPRFPSNQEQSPPTLRLYKQKYRNLTQSSCKIFKKESSNPQKKIAFHQTKNLIFQVKTLKKKDPLTNRRLSQVGQEKQALNKNLLKIYQKSTVANQQKKQAKLQKKLIDEICESRNLKTENNKERSPFRVQLSSTMVFKEELAESQKKQKIKSMKSQISRSTSFKKQPNQKMSFELLMERKLYLLKNKVNSPQKAQTSNNRQFENRVRQI